MENNAPGVQEKQIEIDLGEIFKSIIRRWYLLLLAAILAFAAVYIWNFFLPNKYVATAKIYVLNKQNEDTVTYSDLTGSALLANDYKELIVSKKISDMVCSKLGLRDINDYSITVKDVTNTRFIKVSVEGRNAYNSALVANALAESFTETAKQVMNVENVEIIDEAEAPKQPSSPQRVRNAFLGALVGLLIMAFFIGLISALNKTLKSSHEIEDQLQLSVFARIPLSDDKKTLKRIRRSKA